VGEGTRDRVGVESKVQEERSEIERQNAGKRPRFTT